MTSGVQGSKFVPVAGPGINRVRILNRFGLNRLFGL